ncbi:MAG: hypothetical protein QNJ74_16190 [Trichodesmium sp. MO_231.B1]|nr:hypothetical protein [Trichodesmium sp. MO_231.B1]
MGWGRNLPISNRPRKEIIFPYIHFRSGCFLGLLSIIPCPLSINQQVLKLYNVRLISDKKLSPFSPPDMFFFPPLLTPDS